MLILLLLAVNAWILRAGRSQQRSAAVARTVSLVLWAGIIVAGRMITYSML
jgi:hypothetical protein